MQNQFSWISISRKNYQIQYQFNNARTFGRNALKTNSKRVHRVTSSELIVEPKAPPAWSVKSDLWVGILGGGGNGGCA